MAKSTEYIEDYTYICILSEDNANIYWHYAASDEVVIYTIKYTLLGVVKETDNDEAIFCYRYVGNNFDKAIENVNISIAAPDNNPVQLRYVNKKRTWENYTDNSTLYMSRNKSVSGLIKVSVGIDANVFADLSYSSEKDVRNTESIMSNIDLDGNIFMIFSAGMMVVLVLMSMYENVYKKGSGSFGVNTDNSSCDSCSSCSSCSSCGGCGGGGAD